MGKNKAFVHFEGRSLVERGVTSLKKVFPEVIIAGDPALYEGLADRVVKDIFPGAGPLAGIHAGLTCASHDLIFVAACDLPYVDEEMAAFIVQRTAGFDAAVPCIGGRLQPLFAAYRKTCLGPADRYLQAGGRRVVSFLGEVKVRYLTEADFAGWPQYRRVFFNVNAPAEVEQLQRRIFPTVPVVGIVGPSRAGKTTLIEGLVKHLTAAGYRVAVLKHTWHTLTDTPGKDTERFARAGAVKTALVGPGGVLHYRQGEPSLGAVLGLLEDGVDIIIIEGYKEAPLAKIRVLPAVGEEPAVSLDKWTAAVVATGDGAPEGVRSFSIGDVKGITEFIIDEFIIREGKNC